MSLVEHFRGDFLSLVPLEGGETNSKERRKICDVLCLSNKQRDINWRRFFRLLGVKLNGSTDSVRDVILEMDRRPQKEGPRWVSTLSHSVNGPCTLNSLTALESAVFYKITSNRLPPGCPVDETKTSRHLSTGP